MRVLLPVAATALAFAAPAAAQETADWSGPYAGVAVGLDFQGDDGNNGQVFDTNLDGNFNDTVRTAAGANAFGPGFCNGRAGSTTPAQGCGTDDDRLGFSGHIGYDVQFGNIVVGAVGEFGKTYINDASTSFSTTPASYTLIRDLEYSGNIRGRAGLALGEFLPYVTGGAAFGRIEHSFTTSNAANAFAVNDASNFQWGYTAGGGVETKVAPNFSIGVLYLYNNLKDEGGDISVTRGNAPATNPFVLTNAGGTTIRRTDDRFDWHSARVTASFRF